MEGFGQFQGLLFEGVVNQGGQAVDHADRATGFEGVVALVKVPWGRSGRTCLEAAAEGPPRPAKR